MHQSRRDFLKAMSMTTGALMLPKVSELVTLPLDDAPANFTVRIKTTPIEIAKNRILSMTTYNGQFPGPLLRLKEGERTTIDNVKALEEKGETAMKASLAKGMPHGYEVGYGSFTINGRMHRHGEPIRVKVGERILFHILNGSATEIRSLALPGHSFRVVALDGNPVPNPATVPVLWIGTAERISAIVHMGHPGVWTMGDLADDDRHHGMGIVVEYAR